ncbi:MAG: hypothetical protein BWZ02_01987 [Lentisphaerae bacterium ADurb.BinA184]|nr:MAG: hypothetical protein BWZ02_01987 [Lentisphaerae bacterium ADurb.BinA184]
MANSFVISIMTRDRIGIVADVTTAIRDLGGNLADLSQTVVCGHFTMILVASFPESVTRQGLRNALRAIDAADPFEVGIRQPPEAVVPEPAGYSEDHYVLTAVGADRTGLVAAVSTYLRDRGINIVDFTTRVQAGQYTMILAIDLPAGCNVRTFRQEMQGALAGVGIRLELQHHDIFRATNEV